jgi:hypothetical protein
MSKEFHKSKESKIREKISSLDTDVKSGLFQEYMIPKHASRIQIQKIQENYENQIYG